MYITYENHSWKVKGLIFNKEKNQFLTMEGTEVGGRSVVGFKIGDEGLEVGARVLEIR